ncbi:hypothetical protein HN903_03170 [archaeon]|jgi:hypothetical protein|nr:hypothetical protein [archaeon]MBT7128731.1 hypothetical protein [archaeon]
MIIGIVLAISLAINLTSLLIIITASTGILHENLITGAVIGTTQAASYAFLTLIISLVATFFIISILKNRTISPQ